MIKKQQKGFSLVELLVVVIIIGIIAAIAIPSLLASRRAANEASAIASLRTIHSGEVTYQSVTPGGSYGKLEDLRTAGILDTVLGVATPKKAGYTFNQGAAATTAGYCVDAQPDSATTGTRSFAVDVNGVILGGAASGDAKCTSLVASGTALN